MFVPARVTQSSDVVLSLLLHLHVATHGNVLALVNPVSFWVQILMTCGTSVGLSPTLTLSAGDFTKDLRQRLNTLRTSWD